MLIAFERILLKFINILIEHDFHFKSNLNAYIARAPAPAPCVSFVSVSE